MVVHYVDLRKRAIAAGELKRFTERLGAAALLDHDLTRVPGRRSRLSQRMDDAGIVGPAPRGPAAAPAPARAPRQRGDGRRGRGDVGRLGQAAGALLSAVQATTMPGDRQDRADDGPA